jgi:hypothetical protein
MLSSFLAFLSASLSVARLASSGELGVRSTYALEAPTEESDYFAFRPKAAIKPRLLSAAVAIPSRRL